MGFDYGFNQVELSGGDNWIREPEMRKVMQGIKDIGGSRVRMAALWQIIEPNRGQFNWGAMDRALNMCDEYGLKPLLLLQFPRPGWGGNQSDFGNFARAVAARYGSAGTGQVRDYEVMNEMNMVLNLSPPTASAYVPFLQAAYQGIKAVHPVGSTVITGGVMSCASSTFPFFQTNVDAFQFIKGIYDSGGKGYFDAIGYHWYSDDPGFRREAPSATQMFYLELLQVRDLMVAKGESAKKVWITEYGHGYPTTPTLPQCRDWLKIQTELLLQHAWIDKVFIYNYRNSGVDLGNINNQYGMVNFDFTKKQPVWDYVATLNPANTDVRLTGSGSLSMTVKQKATAGFVGTGMLFANVSPRVSVTASFSAVGQAGAELFGRPAAKFTGAGSLSAVAFQIVSRTATFAAEGSLSADAQPDIFRNPQFGDEGSLTCTVAQQRFFAHDFSTGAKPATFTDFGGQSYYLQFGLALNGNPGADGTYFTGAIYNTDHLSNDQYAEVVLGNGNPGYDRSAMALVRATPSGDRWVGVAPFSNFSQLFVKDASGVEAVINGPGGGNGDRFGVRAVGNRYTLVKNGSDTVTWNDDTGRIAVTNKRTGIAFRHIRSGGALYGTQGIRSWSARDVAPTPTPLSATAAFSGAGALSGVTAVRLSASFAGVGALTAVAELGGDRFAGFTGSGSLTATAFGRIAVSATFTTAGTLAAATASSESAPAFTGEGTLSVAVALPARFLTYSTGGSALSVSTTSTSTMVLAYVTATVGSSVSTTPNPSMTFGSYAMTRLNTNYFTDAASGIKSYSAVFALRNPPTGNNTFALANTTYMQSPRTTGFVYDQVGPGVSVPGTSSYGVSGGTTTPAVTVTSTRSTTVLAFFVAAIGNTSSVTNTGTVRYRDTQSTIYPDRQFVIEQQGSDPSTTVTITTPVSTRYGALAATIPALLV